MSEELKDFIGVYDDTVSKEYCNELIDFFDRVQKMGKTVNRKEFEGTKDTVKSNNIYIFINEKDPLVLTHTTPILKTFIQVINDTYHQYAAYYGGLDIIGKHTLNPDIKIQKTLPGEGYHIWHCEAGGITSSRRLLLCMLYLNDVEEGGETEFLYQHKRISPVAGRVVLCPAYFTHTHRGNPPLKKAKYMINSWIEFIE